MEEQNVQKIIKDYKHDRNCELSRHLNHFDSVM